MRVVRLFSHSIAVILLLVSLCCMIVLITSMFKLPEIPTGYTQIHSQHSSVFKGVNSIDEKLGKFGKMMVEMLPNDLAFTVFVPSELAFERDLRLRVNHSLAPEQLNNTYATVSLILGFSSVPRKIYADLVGFGKEVSFDSISGFTLYISKDSDGSLIVNGVRSVQVDIEKDEMVVHVIDGVIMDAQFEQSVEND
ncbi:uncharacterized protein LOC141643060 [Silene latifolia]|uniref:uncharacterized protein LOC141643060 n=1 Tax=Silene latifolia TaxID=37657 RepID=UPI003D771172